MRRRLRTWQKKWSNPPVLPRPERLDTTVVLPCYNHARFLPFAVQSLVEQTLERFDTVFVDDCSTDETARLLPGLAKSLEDRGRVRVVTHDVNRGQAASLNEAIKLSTTPLVTVLNDDDWLTPTTLESMIGTHQRFPEVVLVGSHSQWFTGAGRPPADSIQGAQQIRRFSPRDMPALRWPNDLNMTHSGMTVARAAWAVVGGYRTHVSARVVPFSDRDFQLRVAALYEVAVIDDPLVWWRSDSSVDAGLNS
jgi:glycosyltransferase involved in cell wall biosynthesis